MSALESSSSLLALDFPRESLQRLDQEIKIEHTSNPDGTPGMKFYKSGSREHHVLAYSPELFLVLRLDQELAGQGYTLGSYSYNEQLIQSWSFQQLGEEEQVSYFIYKFLNSGFAVCPGLLENDMVEPSLNEILIERYRDSIVYRSRNCTRILQDSFNSGLFDRVCSECNVIAQPPQVKSSLDFFKTELQDDNYDIDYDPCDVKNVYYSNDEYKPDTKAKAVQGRRKRTKQLDDIKKSRKKKKTAGIKRRGVFDNADEGTVAIDDIGGPYKTTRLKCVHGCSRSFNGEKNLETHIVRMHTGPVSCPVKETCELRFKKYMGKRMLAHINKSHIKDDSVILSCVKCLETMTGVSRLLSHHAECKRVHTQTTCDQCGQTYKTVAGLNQHIKIAHDKVRFYCDEPGCDKEFKTKNSLKNHKSCVHKNARAFICSFCGKDYKYRHERRVCENKHAGRFLHHCHLCDKKFNIKRKLEQHIRVHTGEKPYGCPVCAYRCARLDNLNTHTKKSHGMTYKEAESVTGISASTTKITIVPPPAPTPVSPPRDVSVAIGGGDIATDTASATAVMRVGGLMRSSAGTTTTVIRETASAVRDAASGIITVRDPLFINCDAVVNLKSKTVGGGAVGGGGVVVGLAGGVSGGVGGVGGGLDTSSLKILHDNR